MRSGLWRRGTGVLRFWLPGATPIRSGSGGPARWGFWRSLRRRCGCWSHINTTAATAACSPTNRSRRSQPSPTPPLKTSLTRGLKTSPTPGVGVSRRRMPRLMIIGLCRWRCRRRLMLRRRGPGRCCISTSPDAALGAGQALVRPEDGGPLTLDQLVELLGRAGCQVRIQPVLDPTEIAPVDGYEIPQRLRAAVRVRQIADVFPFGTCLSPSMDLDHTERYVPTDYGGPPGQTRLGNLGPMARPRSSGRNPWRVG